MELEVIKNGAIIESIQLNQIDKQGHPKEYLVIGRQDGPTADILMEHPSISRHHAVIQFSKAGKVYLYDLGSTWGTFINKNRIEPFKHLGIEDGSILSFGESTRTYVLNTYED